MAMEIEFAMYVDGAKEILLTVEGPDEDTASLAMRDLMMAEFLRAAPVIRSFAAQRKRKRVRTKEELKEWLKTERFAYVHSFDGQTSVDRIEQLNRGFCEDGVQCVHLYAGDQECKNSMPILNIERLSEQINKILPTTILVYRYLTFCTNPVKFMSIFEKLWYQYPDMNIIFGPVHWISFNSLYYHASLFEEAVELWNRQCFDLVFVFDYFRC